MVNGCNTSYFYILINFSDHLSFVTRKQIAKVNGSSCSECLGNWPWRFRKCFGKVPGELTSFSNSLNHIVVKNLEEKGCWQGTWSEFSIVSIKTESHLIKIKQIQLKFVSTIHKTKHFRPTLSCHGSRVLSARA